MRPNLLLAALLLFPAAARPAETLCTPRGMPDNVVDRPFTGPMAYAVARIDGKTVLKATGAILGGASTRLAAELQKARIDEVWLHSPGGAALEGPKMGRVLRKAGVVTRLRAGQACISSCSLAFLGGLIRIAEPGGYYGIHMMTVTRNTPLVVGLMNEMSALARLRNSALRRKIEPEQIDRMVADAAGRFLRTIEETTAAAAADQARYLVEMSISLEFLTEEFAQPAAGVCYLSEPGLRRFNVANAGDARPNPPAFSFPLAPTTPDTSARAP